MICPPDCPVPTTSTAPSGSCCRVAVVVAVQLADVPGEFGGRRRNPRPLEGPVRQDDVPCQPAPLACVHGEAREAAVLQRRAPGTRVTSVPSRTGAAIRAA